MSFVFPTNASQVQAFAGALFGVQAGSATMAQVNADILANGGLIATLNGYYSATQSSTANAASAVAKNLGLTGAALTEGTAYITAQLNAAAPGARGAVISNIANMFGTYTTDATFGAAATAWNTKVAAAVAYTGATNEAIGTANPPVSGIFALTTNVDVFNGTAGNDTFTADNTSVTQAGAADTLNGGAGTDSLTIFGTFTSTTPVISNIENVTVDSMGAGTTWNFASTPDITSLTNSRAVGAATVSVGNGVAVTLANNALATGIQTVNYAAAATSGVLNLNNVNTTTGNAVVQTGAALTTLNVATTGTASSIGTLTTGATTATLNVTGASNLTVIDALAATVVKVDANAFTGKLAIVTGNTAAGTTTAPGLTVIGGTGSDIINITASDNADVTSVTTGLGDDTVLVTAAQIAADTTDTLTGGDGSDTLSINFLNDATGAGLLATALTKVTGFETITLTSNNVGAQTHTFPEGTVRSGVTSFNINGDAGDTFALTGLAAASTVKVSSNAVTVSATYATDTAADTLNVQLDGTTLGTLTAGAFETVNITSTKDTAGATNALTNGTLSAATSVVLTGAGNITGGTIAVAATAAVNAAAYTGDLTATVFTALKSYAGGTGKDEITTAAGGVKQGVTYSGGAGTDKLTTTATAAQDAGLLAVTGFETIALTTDAAGTDAYIADFRNVTDLTTLTLTAGNAADTLTLNRLSADTTVTFASAVGATVTTTQAGTSQKFAFSATGAVASLALDAATVSASIASATGVTGTVTTLTGTSLASLTVTGAGATTITNAVGTTLTSINASAATGALTVVASATATTITGGSAADVITGGNGADTITGGAGGDTLVGGAGADTYVFAATGALNGADVFAANIVGGAGGDKLNFAAFLAGGTLNSPTATEFNGTADVDFANKVIFLASTDGAVAEVDTAAEVAALIQGAGNALALTAGGKGIVIGGDNSAATAGATIYFVNDLLDGVQGNVSAADVVIVGTAALDIDTLLVGNFLFA